MTWKTPIPPDLNKIFGSDHLSQLIFERLLIRSRNESGVATNYWYTPVTLNKGQAVCGLSELGRFFAVDRKTIKRHLEKLQNEYKVVDYLSTRKGTIVTIKNYGGLIKMDCCVDYPKDEKRDYPPPIEKVVVSTTAGNSLQKRDYPKSNKWDTNKNINTNNSKSFKGKKSYSFIPYVLGDLTPEQQRRKVEFI